MEASDILPFANNHVTRQVMVLDERSFDATNRAIFIVFKFAEDTVLQMWRNEDAVGQELVNSWGILREEVLKQTFVLEKLPRN